MKPVMLLSALVLIFCLALPLPVSADTDRIARNRIRDLQEEVATLKTQVEELKAAVETLQARDDEIEGFTKTNFTLIRELARRIPLEGAPAPASE